MGTEKVGELKFRQNFNSCNPTKSSAWIKYTQDWDMLLQVTSIEILIPAHCFTDMTLPVLLPPEIVFFLSLQKARKMMCAPFGMHN